MIQSDSQLAADLRQTQLELAELRREKKSSDLRLSQAARTPVVPGARPVMQNLLRNTDLNHSVNTWFEDAPSAGAKDFEAANIYTHVADTSVQVSDGEIALASLGTLKCLTSEPFEASDAGGRIIVPGAGASGADLVTTIATFVAPDEVTLTTPASFTESQTNLSVRFRLQKLTKTNSKTNPADTVNDALKDAAHPNYATNLTGADWIKSNGSARIGTTHTIDLPFGYYQYVPGDGAGNGTNFIPLHSLFPGRTVFARVNMARASIYVKPKGVFYFGVWNNHDSGLDFAHGAAFTVSGDANGTPAATVEAKYLVIIETDQNYSIVSQILTIPDSPTEASFNPVVFNTLSWTRFAGALRYKIYRKLGAGNVFLLEGNSPTNSYTDNNPATRLDTGSPSFPNPTNARVGVSAYVSTASGSLANLPVDGTLDWTAIEVIIPFPSGVNLSKFFDPHLRIGFTENAAFEVSDVVTDEGNPIVSSIAAQFASFMVGKNFTLTDPANAAHQVSGTISATSAPDTITLSAAPTWDGTGNVLEIEDAAPHGILIDLIGASLTEGSWSPHIEDITGRPQIAASNPNGSSQGGIGGSGAETGDEGGYIINDQRGGRYNDQLFESQLVY